MHHGKIPEFPLSASPNLSIMLESEDEPIEEDKPCQDASMEAIRGDHVPSEKDAQIASLRQAKKRFLSQQIKYQQELLELKRKVAQEINGIKNVMKEQTTVLTSIAVSLQKLRRPLRQCLAGWSGAGPSRDPLTQYSRSRIGPVQNRARRFCTVRQRHVLLRRHQVLQ
ncbi:hypothetical protein FKM82_010671 [Ascaphus truei]